MTTEFPKYIFIEPKSTAAVAAALARLLANLPGFVYRSRADSRRTMEFVSEACRDLTGYDPHRFIGNQSLTYTLLIHPADRPRVDRVVFEAAARGRRFTCCYRLQTAYGGFVEVVDRGVGVLDESGGLGAIEGYVDRAEPLARPALTVFRDGEVIPTGLVGDDDATSELVDRQLRARTCDVAAVALCAG